MYEYGERYLHVFKRFFRFIFLSIHYILSLSQIVEVTHSYIRYVTTQKLTNLFHIMGQDQFDGIHTQIQNATKHQQITNMPAGVSLDLDMSIV